MDMSQAAKTIRQMTSQGKYDEVVKIANRMNLTKITSGLMVLDIVEAYENTGDRKAACKTLYDYYDTHGITGRNMMQKLIELCVETGEIHTAVDLCLQYENDWPDSRVSYLMRYQIAAAADGDYAERIYYLEKYREEEFDERWSYELAKLYDRNNEKEKCAALCHDIICFFGHGKYVEKAANLKKKLVGLTDDEEKVIAHAITKAAEAKSEKEAALQRAWEAENAKSQSDDETLMESVPVQENSSEEKDASSERGKMPVIGGWEADKVRLRRDSYADPQDLVYPEVEESEEEIPEKPVTEEDLRRKAADAKLREIELAAIRRREQKEAEALARANKIAEVTSTSDRYAELEKNSGRELHFSGLKKDTGAAENAAVSASEEVSEERGGILQTFGRFTRSFGKNFQDEDDAEDGSDTEEVEYITVGRNSREYIEDIENRVLNELDMLDDDQIAELSKSQIKEVYELKIHRSLREQLAKMIKESPTGTKPSEEKLTAFVERNPFDNAYFGGIPDAEFAVVEDDSEKKAEAAAENPEKGHEVVAEGFERETEAVTENSEKEAEVAAENSEKETEVVAEDLAEEDKAVAGESEKEEVAEAENPEKEELAETESPEKMYVEAVENSEEAAETAVEDSGKEAEAATENPEKEELAKAESPEKVNVEAADSEEECEAVVQEKENETEKLLSKSDEAKDNATEPEEIIEEVIEPSVLDDIADFDEDLSLDLFTECCKAFAKRSGYEIEETALMTIAVLAEDMQGQSVPLSANNAKKMVNTAIERAKKKSFIDRVFGKYSKKYAVTLKDRHFVWKG